MGGLFSSPKPPKQQEPTRMPVENDQTNAAAAERRRAQIAASKGRASTDLTDNSGTDDLGA